MVYEVSDKNSDIYKKFLYILFKYTRLASILNNLH